LSVSLHAWSPQQLQEAVYLIAQSTMKRAIIIWPGDAVLIHQRFAEHSLYIHAAATRFISNAMPSVGQTFVFDRGFPSLSTSPRADLHGLSFGGPIVMDSARSSPQFVSPGQVLEPVEVYVMFWRLSLPGVVTVELDGNLQAKIPFESHEEDSFETSVPLPDSLPAGTHVVVIRAAVNSSVVAQTSATIVIANGSFSKWPNGLPTPETQYNAALQPPPQTIPPHLLSEFTMNHTADVDYMCHPHHPPPPRPLCLFRPSRLRLLIPAFHQVLLGRRKSVSRALLPSVGHRGQHWLCHATAFLLLQHHVTQPAPVCSICTSPLPHFSAHL
jgi:hypothetical protein